MQKLNMTQIGIIVLTLATAVIHLVPLGIGFGNTLFILNGLGFLGLLVVIFLPIAFFQEFRNYARWALLVYTGITVIAYFLVNPDPWSSVLGLLTKAIEVILMILLFVDNRQ